MPYFDLFIVILLAGFGLFGLWFGFVHTLGSLLGTVVAIYLSSRFYDNLADWLINITGWGDNFSKVLMFILSFLIISRLVGIVFWLVEKFLGIFTKLPFIRGLNHLLGGILGLVEGIIVLGVSLYFIARFPLNGWLMDLIADSHITPYIISPIKILLPLVPDALQVIRSTVSNIF